MAKTLKRAAFDPRQLARKTATTAMLTSLIIHGVLAIFAGVWVVATYIRKDAPKFVAPPAPAIKIPPQTRQHRMNLAANAALACKPTFKARLVSLRPTAFALPEAPAISMNDMLTPDPASMATQMITGLAGTAGAGAGGGFGLAGAGGTGLGTGINFMGIKTQGKRVLLMFDVSGSVVNKANKSEMPLAKIKDETLTLINQLPADSRFGIIQFVRNYKFFNAELVPSTQPNRDLAKQWVETEWNESGSMPRNGKGVIAPEPNGLPPVLRRAFEMKPDVIFLISDGSFERGAGGVTDDIPDEEFEDLFKQLTGGASQRVLFHFIGFQMKPDDEDFWKKMARRNGGQLRQIKSF